MTLENAFIGKAEQPTDAELSAALGPARVLWDQLLAALAADYELTNGEWNSYSRKAGWSLRLKREKRNILYLAPCGGCFRVAFILGDRAMQAARASGLSKPVLKILDEAPRYPEGSGVRMEVKGPKDIAAIRKLTGAKLDN
jgi:hypothetical protein